MTRARFFAAFLGSLGLAGAQDGFVSAQDVAPHVEVNNVCPVCKTEALPYFAKVALARMKRADVCFTGNSLTTDAICRQPTEDDVPKERLVRCLKCSAAFYQDVTW